MGELYEILAKAAMRLHNAQIVSVNDTTWSVLPFDEVTVERGGFSCSTTTHSIVVPSSGLYSIHQGVDAGFPGTEELNLMSYVNGSPYSSEYLAMQGRSNNKPVSMFWESTVTLNAGDEIDIRCLNGDSGNFDLRVIRMYFAMIKEH